MFAWFIEYVLLFQLVLHLKCSCEEKSKEGSKCPCEKKSNVDAKCSSENKLLIDSKSSDEEHSRVDLKCPCADKLLLENSVDHVCESQIYGNVQEFLLAIDEYCNSKTLCVSILTLLKQSKPNICNLIEENDIIRNELTQCQSDLACYVNQLNQEIDELMCLNDSLIAENDAQDQWKLCCHAGWCVFLYVFFVITVLLRIIICCNIQF